MSTCGAPCSIGPGRSSRTEFKAFMLAQSTPFPETIDLARALARTGRYRLMTINNESAELNQYRLEQFGLRDIFITFFSSCWVGILKPARRIYEVALAMSQAEPEDSVFIDDRERNLEPARALGMRTIRFTDALGLRQELAAMGVHIERRSLDAARHDRPGPDGRQYGAAPAAGRAPGGGVRSERRRREAARRVGRQGARRTWPISARQLSAPRVVWVMVPAGAAVESTIDQLLPGLSKGDIIIDGGNSNFKDSIRRAAGLKEKGLGFIDAGTSGGIWGLTVGYCLMIGASPEAFKRASPSSRRWRRRMATPTSARPAPGTTSR